MIAALALFAGACGGGEDKNKIDQNVGELSTTTLDPSATTTTAAVDPGTVAIGGTTTTAKTGAAATTPTTVKANSPTTAGGSAPFNINAIPTAGKQGAYTYSQQGTGPDGPAPASGQLIVSGAGPTQTLARKYDASKAAPFELTIEYRSDGPVLTKAVVRRGVAISCVFATPVHFPPYPPNPGATFSGTATCSNGITATMSGSVAGQRKATVQGKSYDVIVVNAALSVTGSGANVTANLTEWIAPQLGVPAYSRETFSGSTPFGPVSGDVTSTLTNLP